MQIPFLAALQCGDLEFKPYAVIDKQKIEGIRSSFQYHPERGNAHLVLEKKDLFRDDLFFTFEKDQIICRRKFQNLSGQVIKLNELGLTLAGITFGGIPRDDFFYHNENPRIYEVMAFPIDYRRTGEDAKDSSFDLQAGNRWADPGAVCERIGRSPYQPFPAILLGNYQSVHGLVHGTLSQRVFFHNYLLSHADETVTMEIFSGFKDTAWLEIAPGRILTDEWYLGATEQADRIEHVFDNYSKVLRQKLPPLYGATAINRDNMVWGSWNDGLYRNISEELILEEARYLKKHFPTVRWIQVDDGYANRDLKKSAHGLGVPYEGEEGVAYHKFPEGLRAFTDKVRAIGLRPAVWIGGFCPKDTKIYQEHPEWFIDYSYRAGASSPLDVSLPEARRYMTFALDKLITEYGFESVKHDFWSYAFEDSHDLYRNRDASGYEWRDWWLKELRKRIASDGYLQTGCDIVMGNPFLGEFFTNYRYGIDIGSGNWDYVRTNYLWGMACFATHTGDLFVPNSDSVGLFPGLNDTEAMFCLNYCLVTHSMVEIAGRLSQNPDSPRLAPLKKAVCNPNNGQDVFFTKWDYLDPKQKYPAVLYFKTAHFCPAEDQPGLPLRTVGMFNLEDEEQTLSFKASELGLDDSKVYVLTDVWSGEPLALEGSFSCSVAAHGSRLLAVSELGPAQLLDADIRILRSQKNGHTLKLFFDYAAQATLTFISVPTKIILDGVELPAPEELTVQAEIKENSMMEVEF
ncbi:MAG: hypothetical protein GX902_08195 [Lentisphaerae bacterium]|nr:hypothetical protein [Lentisphaerota bacterium]